MRKLFLGTLIIYLSAFLFFQEEIHSFAHHLREENHSHSLSCFFKGEEKGIGISETCHWDDLYLRDSFLDFSFSKLAPPEGVSFRIYPAGKTSHFVNIHLRPKSRGPPVLC